MSRSSDSHLDSSTSVRRMNLPRMRISHRVGLALWPVSTYLLIGLGSIASAQETTPTIGSEFFEARIRPVLVERCYQCHNSAEPADGSLVLDHREGLLQGGDRGAAIVPGKADESLLIEAILFDSELRMPEGGPKLDAAVIQDFRDWINAGAPDPRDEPPSAEQLAESLSWEAIRARRLDAWQFREPVVTPLEPTAPHTLNLPPNYSPERISDIDRWLARSLEQQQLTMAPVADRNTLIRRLALVTTGLPPRPEELDRFTSGDESTWLDVQYNAAVDYYLQSPAFGERWARHWMDWMRYADSHGSEGDPAIPHSYRYRDYLIRAINADVPIDQLVREQLAGDLLEQPRINPVSKENESLIGLGHWRMVQHGFAPVDPADERMRFTDNQIDVVSKAFLGLTVSCARCHDHKFDPISQKDFYAWYGIFASARPALVTIDAHLEDPQTIAQLKQTHQQLREQLAQAWLKAIPGTVERLAAADETTQALFESAANQDHPLHVWRELRNTEPSELTARLQDLQATHAAEHAANDQWRQTEYPLRWSFSENGQTSATGDWFRSGTGLDQGAEEAGGFQVIGEGDRIVSSIQQAGEYTHHLSNRRNGVLTSPTFVVDFDELWIAVSGQGGAQVRFCVQNYPRVIGLLYVSNSPASETMTWVRWDMRYWRGEQMHIELATAGDLPVGAQGEESRSWFGISEVIGRRADQPEPRLIGRSLFSALGSTEPSTRVLTEVESAKSLYQQSLAQIVSDWRDGRSSSASAMFLDYFLQQGLLPNSLEALPELRESVQAYRALEATLPILHRAPGILQAEAVDRPLLARGELNQPQGLVARGFLEAFTEERFDPDSSGRLELAQAIVNDNPLFARVMANRIWHHVFGQGIVTTCDNFGHLGQPPTHPELLDLLALRLSGQSPYEDGSVIAWSTKRMVRELVSSRAFLSSSHHGDPRSQELDPDGRWLSRWQVRRLEAEAIRDSLLAVCSMLDSQMFGPTVSGNNPRRSVYVRVQRNSLDPLLTVFDAPIPFSTTGARPATNVPAQSLMLLNAPIVQQWARNWGQTIAGDSSLTSDRERIERMYRTAFGREPRENEVEQSLMLLEEFASIRRSGLAALEEQDSRVEALSRAIADIETPLRQQLAIEHRDAPSDTVEPAWEWSFKTEDSLRESDAIELHGDAKLDSGALTVNGNGWAQTPPLDRALGPRSLEAWVQLNHLEQQGGGVVSLEGLDGILFDAIVIGEQEQGHWMAGSNFFQRTASFQGERETDAVDRPIHLLWVYESDGTIRAYRDGEAYGRSIRQSPLLEHTAGQTRILLGLRHSPAGGNRLLQGRIYSAALFDRALSPEEAMARSQLGPGQATRAQLLAAMSLDQREAWENLRQERELAIVARRELEQDANGLRDENHDWTNLALTLLNLKELIYLD